MNTGLFDKNGTSINIGDKTRLVLDDGEVREFDVCFKTVQRTTIKTLRGFAPESVDVSITGIFFCWKGNDLLPCVDENGVSDVEKMEVISRMPEKVFQDNVLLNRFENPGENERDVVKVGDYVYAKASAEEYGFVKNHLYVILDTNCYDTITVQNENGEKLDMSVENFSSYMH